MGDFEKQGGVAFILIFYTHKNLLYYLTYEKLYQFWKRSLEGGRKSFRFDELDESFILPHKSGILVPYLDMINKDLSERDEDTE